MKVLSTIAAVLGFTIMSGINAFACGMPGCSTETSSAISGGEPARLQLKIVKKKLSTLGLTGNVSLVKEIPGLIEIDGQKGATYFTDVNARYLIVGHLLDPIARRDLTRDRQNQLKIGTLKTAIQKRQLIEGGDLSAKNAIVVFTDPDCPFCRRLETGLMDHSGVKAYYVMSPLVQLHPLAEEHTKAIMCSKNMNQALESVMLRNQIPQTNKCANPHYADMRAEHARLSQLYHVNGTPTLVRLTDGQVWTGYMPPSLLKEWASGKNVSAATVNAAIQAGL